MLFILYLKSKDICKNKGIFDDAVSLTFILFHYNSRYYSNSISQTKHNEIVDFD